MAACCPYLAVLGAAVVVGGCAGESSVLGGVDVEAGAGAEPLADGLQQSGCVK